MGSCASDSDGGSGVPTDGGMRQGWRTVGRVETAPSNLR